MIKQETKVREAVMKEEVEKREDRRSGGYETSVRQESRCLVG